MAETKPGKNERKQTVQKGPDLSADELEGQ